MENETNNAQNMSADLVNKIIAFNPDYSKTKLVNLLLLMQNSALIDNNSSEDLKDAYQIALDTLNGMTEDDIVILRLKLTE